MRARAVQVVVALAAVGCSGRADLVDPEPRGSGAHDGPALVTGYGGDAGSGPSGDEVEDPACDLRGDYLLTYHTRNVALGAAQLATIWSYMRFSQQGRVLRIEDRLDCGFAVRGTTDVSLGDETLRAMAERATSGIGVEGTFYRTEDGERCALTTERIYILRGANRARFLDAYWHAGGPSPELDELELPTNARDGMEDWDHDGHEGLTLLTGFGDRYVAQVDWFSLSGEVPTRATEFGGQGVLEVDYDVREAVSAETAPLLRTSAAPMPPGWAYLSRLDGPPEGADLLEACKGLQATALARFGEPPRP